MPSRSMRAALLLLASLIARPAPAAQRAPDAPPAAVPATGSVHGLVTNSNGVPVRGAEVRVRDTSGRDNRMVTTDEQGYFQMDNLLPGSWNVSVSKSGYIAQQYGQRGPFSAPQAITVAARQRVDANFVLRRGGAVAGRLFDEYGDPVAGARVQLLRLRYQQGRRRLAPSSVIDQTDDTGAFRLYAVPPGDYYLTATPALPGVPTYYPGTSSQSEAQRLRLGPGEELAGISFGLQPARSVAISGVVLSSSGAPAANASLTLLSEAEMTEVATPLGNFGRTAATGTFMLAGVAPGSYMLRARVGAVFDPANGQGEEALVPLVVGPEGTSGLTITAIPTPAITGTIVPEGGTLPNTPIAVGVSEAGSSASFKMTARRGAAGGPVTFRVPGMVGRLALAVDVPRGWMLKQVELDGNDITDRLFELRGPSPDVRITLTNRLTRVAGTVRAERRTAGGATVLLFAQDAARWAYPTRHVVTARADDRGAFTAEGLPPHDYLAVALEDLEAGASEDPDFLESLRERAAKFSIDYGDTKALTLDLLVP